MEENKNIQDNNEIQNTLMNEPKKDNSVMILLIAIIISLAGYIVYTKVFAGDKPTPPKENDTKETSKKNEPKDASKETSKEQITFDINKLAGITYKTPDEKNVLEIVSKNDKDAISLAGQHNEEALSNYFDYYFAYYNDILYVIDKDENNKPTGKYIVLGGTNLEEENNGQCLYSNEFIVNIENNTLVNLNYSQGSYFLVNKANDKYYFSSGSCAMAFIPFEVYDEKLNNIGQYYFDSDNNGNVYVLNNGYITKYDKESNIIKQSTQQYDINNINSHEIIYNDTLYIIAIIDEKMYLVDSMNENKYELDSLNNYFNSPGADAYPIEFELNKNLISLYGYKYNDETGNDERILLYTFNPETKELIKK